MMNQQIREIATKFANFQLTSSAANAAATKLWEDAVNRYFKRSNFTITNIRISQPLQVDGMIQFDAKDVYGRTQRMQVGKRVL